MKIRIYKILIILLFLSVSFPNLIFTEEQTEPYWVYLKRAEILKEKGEYAQAIIEAKRSKNVFTDEKLNIYSEEIKQKYRDKTESELMKLVLVKKNELLKNDDFPSFHELMGDLYVLTDFITEAENEYKKAISQSKFFEYPQKGIEIRYKLASIQNKKLNYELEDIYYREITGKYFELKKPEYWERVKFNIKDDPTLGRVFKIYQIDGMEYLQALYKIGRRSALLQRSDDAMYYLVNSAIVWMTYYYKLIKKHNSDFKYTDPSDFINYIAKQRLYEYTSDDYIIDEIFFYIGYLFKLQGQSKLMDHYFGLAKIFSKGTKRELDIANRIEYFNKDKDHILTYEEILD